MTPDLDQRLRLLAAAERALVVHGVRHYGCMQCEETMRELAEAIREYKKESENARV
jgi:hypothetical protein